MIEFEIWEDTPSLVHNCGRQIGGQGLALLLDGKWQWGRVRRGVRHWSQCVCRLARGVGGFGGAACSDHWACGDGRSGWAYLPLARRRERGWRSGALGGNGRRGAAVGRHVSRLLIVKFGQGGVAMPVEMEAVRPVGAAGWARRPFQTQCTMSGRI